MARTTITVDTAVRDRLAALARRHHRALGDELAVMVDEAERRVFWERVSDGYAQVAEDSNSPYDAADEFPEYAELRAEALPTPAGLADDMSGYAHDTAGQ